MSTRNFIKKLLRENKKDDSWRAAANAELAKQGLRLASTGAGEPGWYTRVTVDGESSTVWATDLQPKPLRGAAEPDPDCTVCDGTGYDLRGERCSCVETVMEGAKTKNRRGAVKLNIFDIKRLVREEASKMRRPKRRIFEAKTYRASYRVRDAIASSGIVDAAISDMINLNIEDDPHGYADALSLAIEQAIAGVIQNYIDNNDDDVDSD